MKVINDQYTDKNIEIGIEAYRQNLFKASESLNNKEFAKLVEVECAAAGKAIALEKFFIKFNTQYSKSD